MQITSRCPPIVSIGMPVFNCASTIAQAISSILNQSFKEWELLIIDDGSTDNTREIALSFDDPRIIVTKGAENKRLPMRLNECVCRARGRFFARMDGDDIAYPQRLQCQLEYLQSHPEVDLVGGWVVVFRNDGTVLGARRGLLTHEQMWAHPWKGVLMPHSTWVGKIGWFRDNTYRTGTAVEDQDLLSRTCHTSRFATVPEIVLGYREDRLSLPYLVSQRWHACQHIVPNAIQQGRPTNAALCIFAEAAKALTEAVAICTGLNHRMLRRRAMPIDGDEAREWQSVWQEVRLATEKNRLDSRTSRVTQVLPGQAPAIASRRSEAGTDETPGGGGAMGLRR
jgi:hypothetical protein